MSATTISDERRRELFATVKTHSIIKKIMERHLGFMESLSNKLSAEHAEVVELILEVESLGVDLERVYSQWASRQRKIQLSNFVSYLSNQRGGYRDAAKARKEIGTQKVKAEKAKKQAAAEREHNKASKREKENAKSQKQQQRKQEISERFAEGVSEDVLSAFKKGRICLGMPYEMAQFILGPAYEKKVSESASKTVLKAKFGRGKKNQRGNYTYKTEVTFENDHLKSFKDL